MRLLFVLALLSLPARAAEFNVFAAASLSDALREIARAYEAVSGDQVHFNFGASSTLALQIKHGAPADVFFSADEAKMDDLAQAGLLVADSRRRLLSNSLVIVVNAEHGAAVTTPADLAGPAVRRLALAEPQTVPAGIYAREWLRQAGLWEKVAARVVPTENVRACLAAVEAGNADAGIVYKTDALISKRVKIAHEVPVSGGPNIAYPLALVNTGRAAGPARRFATFLAGPEAAAVFKQFGFLPAR